jgi:hypothetical protein
MATATITPEVNASSPQSQGAQSSTSSASLVPTPEISSSSPSSANTISASQAGEATQSAELNPQDFDSIEDFAQALIDQRQPAAADTQPSAEAEPGEVSDIGEHELPEDSGAQPGATALPEEEGEELQPSDVGLDLDTEDFLSTKALNDRINTNAALKQALEADQPLRNAMFRNARLAGEAAGYREVFPDVESARLAADQAAEFAALDHAFLNAGNRDGAEKFFSRWAEMALLNDADGNILRDQHGNPRMHGAWSAVNQHLFNSQLDYIRNKAEKTGNHELLAALDVIRESTHSPNSPAEAGSPGAKAPGYPSPGVIAELPPHLKAAADSINRREQELTRQQLAQQQKEAEAFDSSVAEEASAKINSLVEPVLEKAALSDFVRQTAREKIENAIVDSLNRNRFFQARMAELKRLPMNDEAMQQQLNLVMTHVHAIAGPIVRQVLREASQPVISAQEERRAKIESQIARTRSEPRSVGGAAPINGANQRPEQLLATAREQLRDELGDEPNLQQVIERFARLKANR